MDEYLAPVRVCCGRPHHGPVCPDGKVMCCLCFNRFDQADLAVDADGVKEDVCGPCAVLDRTRPS